MNTRIIIIVLNWNGNQETIECLKSLEKVDDSNFSVLVVDNNSTIHLISKLKKKFNQFNFLELNQNHGYSGGNNRGFEFIKNDADFVCFLNNDVIVSPDFIKAFRKGITQYGEQNIFGPKIFFEFPSEKIWYGGGIVNLKKGQIFHKSIGLNDNQVKSVPGDTNYITGCCLLVSSKLFEKLNGFDEQFNMYAEDVDLCLRAKQQNINCIYVPESKIWHKISSSTGGRFSLKKYIKKIKSIRKLIQIHEPKLNSTIITIKSIFSSLFYSKN